jgi:hypothetical protein
LLEQQTQAAVAAVDITFSQHHIMVVPAVQVLLFLDIQRLIILLQILV